MVLDIFSLAQTLSKRYEKCLTDTDYFSMYIYIYYCIILIN